MHKYDLLSLCNVLVGVASIVDCRLMSLCSWRQAQDRMTPVTGWEGRTGGWRVLERRRPDREGVHGNWHVHFLILPQQLTTWYWVNNWCALPLEGLFLSLSPFLICLQTKFTKVLFESGMAHSSVLQRWKQRVDTFSVILNDIRSSRLAWAT